MYYFTNNITHSYFLTVYEYIGKEKNISITLLVIMDMKTNIYIFFIVINIIIIVTINFYCIIHLNNNIIYFKYF